MILFISIFLVFFAFGIIAVYGFNWSVDFTGGILIEIFLEDRINVAAFILEIQEKLSQLGFKRSMVRIFSTAQDIVIKLPLSTHDTLINHNFTIDIKNFFDKNVSYKFVIKQINWIGPKVGSNLIRNGIMAVSIALLCILIYIALRFEWRLAIGAVVSLIHDVIIIFGVLSLLEIEIDSTIIAALMSAIGYSLNDSIVIFDRLRENFRNLSKMCVVDVFNISLSQILNRTIITSITTIMVLLVLLIFGGFILYGFSITLLIGVIVGTISSIYIASVLAFILGVEHKYFINS